MSDVVGVDERIDEVTRETIIAAAARGGANGTGMDVRFHYGDGPSRRRTGRVERFSPYRRPSGGCHRGRIVAIVWRIIIDDADMPGTARGHPSESRRARGCSRNWRKLAPGHAFVRWMSEDNL